MPNSSICICSPTNSIYVRLHCSLHAVPSLARSSDASQEAAMLRSYIWACIGKILTGERKHGETQAELLARLQDKTKTTNAKVSVSDLKDTPCPSSTTKHTKMVIVGTATRLQSAEKALPALLLGDGSPCPIVRSETCAKCHVVLEITPSSTPQQAKRRSPRQAEAHRSSRRDVGKRIL